MSDRKHAETIEMIELNEIDTVGVERRARQMRAEAFATAMRNFGAWIGRRVDALRSTPARAS